MNDTLFIFASVVYITSLAVLDGVFNRLVFREDRKLSYFSNSKQRIYAMSEWRYIGLILLLVLPIVLPFIVIYLSLGVKYLILYATVLVLLPWDNIFGKIVFDSWFGDTPSIALPFFGWFHFSLKLTLIVRFVVASILVLLLAKLI